MIRLSHGSDSEQGGISNNSEGHPAGARWQSERGQRVKLEGDLGASQYRTSKERKEERPKGLEVMDRKAECKVAAICLRSLPCFLVEKALSWSFLDR